MSWAGAVAVSCAYVLAAAPTGLVVEEVVKGGAAARAGLARGEVLSHWAPKGGPLRSPVDLAEVELAQAPRGPVVLRLRGGARASVTLASGRFKLRVRPVLTGALLDLFTQARAAEGAAQWELAAQRWEALRSGLRGRDAGWAFASLMELHAKAGQGAALLRVLEAAVAQARRAGDAPLEAWLQDVGGQLLERANRLPEAQAAYEAALALRQAAKPDGLAVAATLVRLGSLARVRGELPRGEALFLRAVALFERQAPRSLELGNALTGLGSASFAKGELSAAHALYQRAMALVQPLAPESTEASTLWGNFGLIAKARGDLVEAEALFRKNLALEEQLEPGGLNQAFPLNFLGTLARAKGDLLQAQGYAQRALELFRKHRPGSVSVAGCLANLGNLAFQRGELSAAEDYHRQALALRRTLAPDSLDVAASLGTLGEVAMKRGKLEEAQQLFTQVLALKERLAPGSLLAANALVNLGEVSAKRGDAAASLRFHQQALALRARLAPGSAAHVHALHAVGRALVATGDAGAAAAQWRAAVTLLEGQGGRLGRSEDERAGYASQFAPLFHDAMELAARAGRNEEAFELWERSRAQGLLELLSSRALADAQLPEALVEAQRRLDAQYDRTSAQLRALDPAKDAAKLDQGVGQLAELAQERARLGAQIRQAAPRVGAVRYPQPLKLQEARRALDAGTVLLGYSVGPARSLLFVVRPEGEPVGLEVLTLPLGEAALRARVEALRGFIRRGREVTEVEPALLAQAEGLFNDLVRPAARAVEQSRRVLLAPEGPLEALPFAALVRARQPLQYFVQWRPLHAASSVTTYAALREARSGAVPVELVAFADPTLAPGSGLPALPGAREEARALAERFGPGAKVFVGAEASKERVLGLSGAVRYLHFATHGVLDARLPLDSALVLAAPPGAKEDALLRAWEVLERLRVDVELVTLSGCDTGLGRELSGEGMMGLARAFQVAGARAVAASQWAVPDPSTAALMDRFYAGLREGAAKDEALAAAQRALIADPTRSHPFHWAAFQLRGGWR